MLRTRVTDLLRLDNPVALGGMPPPPNTPALTAAVSAAGGIGILGCTWLDPTQIADAARAIRARTDKPFGLNSLLFDVEQKSYAAALDAKPALISLGWARRDQDLRPWVDAAHAADSKVSVMVGDVREAVRGAEAGADLIVAQGTEGGGHVGWMGLSVLLPMVVDAVDPIPVLAAGGIADGRGLAAALAFGADGVLLGTRFLATEESGVPMTYKQAIIDSDGHDTVLTETPDIVRGQTWPGAMCRVRRNRFIERWAGREWALRENLGQAAGQIQAALETGDVDEAPLFFGQDAGLIRDVLPAGEIVRNIVAEAENIVTRRLPRMRAL
jgi:NAD(P)H-dependent flavin oxidoreductase YrpB (nitropropane dioxygenase family)